MRFHMQLTGRSQTDLLESIGARLLYLARDRTIGPKAASKPAEGNHAPDTSPSVNNDGHAATRTLNIHPTKTGNEDRAR
jgi:hypothetical protein